MLSSPRRDQPRPLQETNLQYCNTTWCTLRSRCIAPANRTEQADRTKQSEFRSSLIGRMEDTPTSVTNCRAGSVAIRTFQTLPADCHSAPSQTQRCVWINKSMAESPAFLASSRPVMEESHGSAGPPTQMQSGGGPSWGGGVTRRGWLRRPGAPAQPSAELHFTEQMFN